MSLLIAVVATKGVAANTDISYSARAKMIFFFLKSNAIWWTIKMLGLNVNTCVNTGAKCKHICKCWGKNANREKYKTCTPSD